MSNEPQALIPMEIRAVDFYGDEVTGALVEVDQERQVYVPIRPLCERLGLDWSGQYQRMRRDEVLNDALRTVRINRSESVGITPTNSRRGDPNSVCLPLKLLPGFLFGISTERVKDQTIRAKLIIYRRECYDVLWDAFKASILPQSTALQPPQVGGAAMAYELATAVQQLARQQMDVEQRLDKSAKWARGIEDRVGALELQVSPQEHISDAQIGELAGAVKTVAAALETSGKANGYQRVYAELYRRFAVSSYKSLPQRHFDAAIAWLHSWYKDIEPDKTKSL